MDILKTFDKFYRESISVIRERIINIIFVNSSTMSNDYSIKAEIKKNQDFQISVFNNKKTYKLLTTAWSKYQKKQDFKNQILKDQKIKEETQNENNKIGIYNKR